MNIDDISRQIAEFLGINIAAAKTRLSAGFHANHRLVAEDFIKNNTDVNDSNSLLNWYRNTDAYIWELSSYHLDQGFNYSGMCEGISLGLFHSNKKNVLSIGDGIGTLSLDMAKRGLSPTYHDLNGSKTAGFAQYRFSLNPDLNIKTLLTDDFSPNIGSKNFEAVVALDFLEHVVNVEEWAVAIFNSLKKNGVFIPNNAFGIGDAEHGNSIPMHLAINNKYEWEWDPMLIRIGFIRHENNQWWVKP